MRAWHLPEIPAGVGTPGLNSPVRDITVYLLNHCHYASGWQCSTDGVERALGVASSWIVRWAES